MQIVIIALGLSANVSLSGFVATMLRIDEQQGRLRTRSAIVRKGLGAHVPAAHARPAVIAKPTSIILPKERRKALATALCAQAQRQDSDLCDDGERLVAPDTAWPPARELHLVALGCSRGAYNLTPGFRTMKGDDPATARPVVFPRAEGGLENMLTNAAYDPKTELFSKGRGIGDCGAIGSYAWTGATFVRTAFSTMSECRGVGSDGWVQMHRSVVR